MMQQRMNSTSTVGGVCTTGIARRVIKKEDRRRNLVHRAGIEKKGRSKIRQKQSLHLDVVHEGRLQELFHSCLDVFKGPGTVPSQSDVRTLCRILDNMTLEDVGLSRQMSFFNTQNAAEETPRVTTTTIYKSDNFSVRPSLVRY
ncbi:2-aminoethanethiol dioxygenase [Tripterygium wilfordii]|uniref:2-aminoethanethiol dioxygenase n=1 Tax=Tripterygium wilfordii TaxID=458696 RepID=A0A7J7BW17_TRIWF|nr:2-aminoethanethiol dioxygenase [Tripterygium wilfordii]